MGCALREMTGWLASAVLLAGVSACGDDGPIDEQPIAKRPAAHAGSNSATGAGASLVGPADPSQVFWDGTRRVGYERIAAPSEDPTGRGLTAVRLYYPERQPVHAWVDRSVIVKLAPGHERDPQLDELGVELLRPLMPSIGLWLAADVMEGSDALSAVQRLGQARGDGPLRGAIPNLYLRMQRQDDPYIPDDPRFGGQWYFDKLDMPTAWALELGSPDVNIVVVDTGCDLDHPDLAAKMDPGLDAVDDDDDPTYDPSEPGAAHGTACAGIIAAVTNNGEGIAGGCPECRMRCVRLISPVALPISTTISAFEFALQVDAAVVSNSWGYVDPTPVPSPVADAINNVFDNGRSGKGAVVVFAAGNDSREINDDELQAVRGVLNVGAINNYGDQTPFTNYGNSVDLVAYTGTLTTDIVGPQGDDPGDYTSLFGGTSSSCPVVAGIAGLLASAAPERTAAELVELLIATARPAPYAQPDANGHDPVFGYGIVDPVAVLRDVLGITDPEHAPEPGPDAGTGGSAPAPPPPGAASDDSGCSLQRTGLDRPHGALLLAMLCLVLAGARRRWTARSR